MYIMKIPYSNFSLKIYNYGIVCSILYDFSECFLILFGKNQVTQY